VAKLLDRSSFAGSVATADRLIRTMLAANIPLVDVIKMASLTPARILKCNDHKGSLEVGKDADIVIFDDQVNISTTMINGRVVYKAE
jgi:N-acetylglucosamine-6-phosphate deacetylase